MQLWLIGWALCWGLRLGEGQEVLTAAQEAYLAGQDERVIRLLEEALPTLPRPSRAALWLFLARCRLNQHEEALRQLTKWSANYRGGNVWDYLVDYYCHRLTAERVQALLVGPRERCLGLYYLGAHRRYYEGDPEGAAKFFRECLETYDLVVPEYRLAQAELEAPSSPPHTALYACRKYRLFRHRDGQWALKYPPDWHLDWQGDIVVFLGPRAEVAVSYLPQPDGPLLARLKQTAQANGLTVTRAEKADLRWAGLKGEAWEVEGRKGNQRMDILAVEHGEGWLLLLFSTAAEDYPWQRAYFNLMLQSLGP